MKSNYEAWDVDVKEFPKHGSIEDQLIFLLHYAILDPSSHNSQPWQFNNNGPLMQILLTPRKLFKVTHIFLNSDNFKFSFI